MAKTTAPILTDKLLGGAIREVQALADDLDTEGRNFHHHTAVLRLHAHLSQILLLPEFVELALAAVNDRGHVACHTNNCKCDGCQAAATLVATFKQPEPDHPDDVGMGRP